MRISTTMQFTRNLNFIQRSNSSVDQAANKYNTGLKFQTAGEDPAGMSSKVKYEGSIAAYDQYKADGILADNALSEEETAMQSLWEALSSIYTRLQQCIDGSNDQSSMNAIADEIEQMRDHLFNLTNTQNTEGEYIFSGADSSRPCFTLTSDGHYTCQADGSTRSVQVAPNVAVQVSDSGLDIFENCKLAYEMSYKDATGASMATPDIAYGGVSDYGDFNDLFEQYYSSATGVANRLRIEVTAPAGDAKTSTFELYDPAGTKIYEGEVKSNGYIDVKGMEFELGSPTYAGTINIDLKKPRNDNILNQLTDIVSTIRNEGMNKSEKIGAITRVEEDVNIAMTHYDSYRGKIGARQNTITDVLQSNEALSNIKKESKANVSEIDAFEAASNLVVANNQLTVSRQIYSNLTKQSLFDYI